MTLLIDKERTIEAIQASISRFEPHQANKYDEGLLDGLRFAVRIVRLQEEAEVGQVAFMWEED